MGNCADLSSVKTGSDYSDFTLKVISKISGEPENGVFDFQYNNHTEYHDRISSWTAEIKTNWFLHAMQTEKKEEKENDKKPSFIQNKMLAFAFAQGSYYIYNGTEIPRELTWENLQNHSWMVINKVRHNKQSMIIDDHKYKLQNGDLIRLGRIVLKVTIVNKQFENAKKSNKNMEKRDNIKLRRAKNKNESFSSIMPYISLEENKANGGKYKSPIHLVKNGAIVSDSENNDSITENISQDDIINKINWNYKWRWM